MKTNGGLWRPGMIAFVMLGAGLATVGLAVAQNTPERTLVVNGKPVSGALTEIQGRIFVDLQLLSQALGATLTIDPNRITLATIAVPAAGNAPQATQQLTAVMPAGGGRLSTNFRAAAISALGEMREWQGAVESVITTGVPVNGPWPQDYRDRAESAVNQAKVFAMTDEDQSAARLLQNEFTYLRDWSETVVTERRNLNASRFVDPNALKNDTALAKITGCGRFLAGMISSGEYSDSGSCH